MAVVFIGATLFIVALKGEKTKGLNPNSYIVGKMVACAKQKIPRSCLGNAAIDFLNHFSLPTIINVLNKNAGNQDVFLNCHETLHYLGREDYKREGISKAISSCTDLCVNGCYHGVFEGYFMDKKLYQQKNMDQVVEKDIQDFCKPDGNVKEVTCIHGAGHVCFL